MKRLLLPLLAAIALPTSLFSGEVVVNKDPMTDLKKIWMYVESENYYKDLVGQSKKALLVIGCLDDPYDSEQTLQVSIETVGLNIAGDKSVDLRLDNDKTFTERWTNRNDQKGFQKINGREFLKQIKNKSRLLFAFEDYPYTPRTILEFDLVDLNDQLNEGEKEGCKF